MDKSKVEQNRKVEYRKSRKGRSFFRIEGETLTRVWCKHSLVEIAVCEGKFFTDDILLDDSFIPATEAEFNEAYSDALAIVTMKKIP